MSAYRTMRQRRCWPPASMKFLLPKLQTSRRCLVSLTPWLACRKRHSDKRKNWTLDTQRLDQTRYSKHHPRMIRHIGLTALVVASLSLAFPPVFAADIVEVKTGFIRLAHLQ